MYHRRFGFSRNKRSLTKFIGDDQKQMDNQSFTGTIPQGQHNHVVNYNSNTSNTHINDGNRTNNYNHGHGRGHYYHYYGGNDDPYYWGSDWVWCLALAAFAGFFIFFFFLFLLVPYNNCYDGRCRDGRYYCGDHYCSDEYEYYRFTGKSDHGSTFSNNHEKEAIKKQQQQQLMYNDRFWVQQRIKEKKLESHVRDLIKQRQATCPKGTHAWIPDKLVHNAGGEDTQMMKRITLDDISCVVNYYAPNGFDPEIMERDSQKAHDAACSAFDFESFVCPGWYGDSQRSTSSPSDKQEKEKITDDVNMVSDSIKSFFQRTISLFKPSPPRKLSSFIDESGHSDITVDDPKVFHHSRGFSQLAYMNQKLLSDVITQLSQYSPTGWFDDESLSDITGQVEKNHFRRLISSCVKSISSIEDKVMITKDHMERKDHDYSSSSLGTRETPLKVSSSGSEAPQDIDVFIDAVHAITEPIRMVQQKRDDGEYSPANGNSEWEVGRAFGRAQCMGISPIINVRATSHFLDRCKPVLTVDIKNPVGFVTTDGSDGGGGHDTTSYMELYCSMTQFLPWKQNAKKECMDTMKRVSNAYEAFVNIYNNNNDNNDNNGDDDRGRDMSSPSSNITKAINNYMSKQIKRFTSDAKGKNDDGDDHLEYDFFNSNFWWGFLNGMSEPVKLSSSETTSGCIDPEIMENMGVSEKWITPEQIFKDSKAALIFYSMALLQQQEEKEKHDIDMYDDDYHDFIHVKDYESTWTTFLEAAIASDYLEFIDSKRLQGYIQPLFNSMYGYDMYTGQHPLHTVHKETFGSPSSLPSPFITRSRKNKDSGEMATRSVDDESYVYDWLKMKEWTSVQRSYNQPWSVGHKEAFYNSMKHIKDSNEDIIFPVHNDKDSSIYHMENNTFSKFTAANSIKWMTSMVDKWIQSRVTTSTTKNKKQQEQTTRYLSPERGTLEKEKDSSNWGMCAQLAATYMPSVVDDAFASMAVTKEDIDMISDVINRVIEQTVASIENSQVLSPDAKKKMVKKAKMITIRIASPWISRLNNEKYNNNNNNNNESQPTDEEEEGKRYYRQREQRSIIVPPDHGEMKIKGKSLWMDVFNIKRYTITNNLKAAFSYASSDIERRDRMTFHSGGLPHFGMPTSTVNAYYSPVENSINILSGIMGVPFHHKDYNMATRLGTIGAVVGHEIAHGFDSTGIHFDPYGSYILQNNHSSSLPPSSSWVSPSDMKAYEEREQCFIDKYTTVTRLGNANDGVNTLGENIADTMGLRSALEALKKYNRELPLRSHQEYPDKWMLRDFLQSYGQMWCSDMSKEQELFRIQTDVHSPGGTRINGAISSLYFENNNVVFSETAGGHTANDSSRPGGKSHQSDENGTHLDPLYIAYGCRRDLLNHNIEQNDKEITNSGSIPPSKKHSKNQLKRDMREHTRICTLW